MKIVKTFTQKLKEQAGASAVEFAIVLPLLLLFIFGIIEFSLMFYDKAVITNASREGARAGILFHAGTAADPRPSVSDITAVVDSYSKDRLITFGTDTVMLDPGNLPTPCSTSGDMLTVTVKYNYDFLIVPDLLAAFFS